MIEGTLGKKPELKTGQFGSYCYISLAENNKNPKTGEEVTTWHDIIVQGKMAEKVCQLEKGRRLVVELKPRYSGEGENKKTHLNARKIYIPL